MRRTDLVMTTSERTGAVHEISADVIRALAILFIVTVHVSVPVCREPSLFGSFAWWTANVFGSIARIGVPLFFMLSGRFLLAPNREESLSTFFRRRGSKVLIPFLSWGVFYLFLKHHWEGQAFSAKHVIGEIIQGPVYLHFWFFYVLFGLYLVTPLLRVLVRNLDKVTAKYFLALWFAVNGVLPVVTRFSGLNFGIDFVVVNVYTGYFVAGALLKDLPVVRHRVLLGALTVVSVAAGAVGSRWASSPASFDEFFVVNGAPNVIISSVSLYLLLGSFEGSFRSLSGSHWIRLSAVLSRHSFGIYLVHPFILQLLRTRWHWLRPEYFPLLNIPFSVLVVIVISLTLSALLRRTPLLNRTVGG